MAFTVHFRPPLRHQLAHSQCKVAVTSGLRLVFTTFNPRSGRSVTELTLLVSRIADLSRGVFPLVTHVALGRAMNYHVVHDSERVIKSDESDASRGH